MVSNTNDDRPRGILSPADREYLRDGEDLSPQAAWQRQNAIRERVHAGLLDFHPLLPHLPDDLRREVFREEKVGSGSGLGAQSAVLSALAFMYLGLSDTTDDDPDERFAEAVSYAISMAHERRGEATESVDVSIGVELGGPLGDLDGPLDELPEATLKQLMLSDRITLDEYTEAIKNQD